MSHKKDRLMAALLCLQLVGCSSNGDSTSTNPSGTPTPSATVQGPLELSEAQLKSAALTTGEVTRQEIADSLEMVGEFRGFSQSSANLDSPIAGRVVQLSVNPGDEVKKGQVVAVLESGELARLLAEYHHAERKLGVLQATEKDKLQQVRQSNDTKGPLEQSRLSLQSAHATEETTLAELHLQRDNLARVEALLAEGIASEKQAVEARARKNQSEIAYRSAGQETALATKRYQRELALLDSGAKIRQAGTELSSEIGLAQEEVWHLRELLKVVGKEHSDDSPLITLRAPQEGTVGKVSVTVGEHLGEGQRVVDIMRGGAVYPVVRIPESHLSEVAIGDQVQIFPGSSDRPLAGKLLSLAPELDLESRTLDARVQLSETSQALRAGVFLRAEMASNRREALTVALSAVTEFEGEKSVYLALSPYRFERRRVELGSRWNDVVEVKSGLQPGDKVVVSGVFLLKSLELGTGEE